ncbi:P-loop NTPase fold protein [Pseudomonas alliivorans]|nr:P-loop NTPase fold protein [Pseudomonas alliivorans]MEE4700282.1 P-loop NTPase fold protein [Pseudomonas alliivorans]MEE4736261.1 P-loop NTPase fold protein [Pseudomonas alliivorans]
MEQRDAALFSATHALDIEFDLPLQPNNALDSDNLSRKDFAEIAASTLRKVSGSGGLVVSIEGSWGSGKSSVLAMIQALLTQQSSPTKPIIVHFNPWLVGDKEALLRQFLSSIAKAIEISDKKKATSNVVKAIKNYSKLFDLVKLIPGAEPWVSIAKPIVEATTGAAEAFDFEPPDIEKTKDLVETELRKFPHPVIVFIDDIDRLFPSEVFEMIRIIKAIGGLPQIGYVLAWDPEYVSKALYNLKVPQPYAYLDKIVQIRLTLPSLSRSSRGKLFDAALQKLDPAALSPHFNGQDNRLAHLYHSGLRDLLEQPRDVVRVFNTLKVIEPLLRGEIVFADILALAALSVKAPKVFELIKNTPQFFVEAYDRDQYSFESTSGLVEKNNAERQAAYESGPTRAVRKVVHFIFPEVAAAEKNSSLGNGVYSQGVIQHPSRLAIALQLGLSDGDTSIKAARKYFQEPNMRISIASEVPEENCVDFIDMLSEIGSSFTSDHINDLDTVCLSIAKLVDLDNFVNSSHKNKQIFSLNLVDLALKAVKDIITSLNRDLYRPIMESVTKDRNALSCAAELIRLNYTSTNRPLSDDMKLEPDNKKDILETFKQNVIAAAKTGYLLKINRADQLLWTLSRVAPEICPQVYGLLEKLDSSLDTFALCFLGGGWDSVKGDYYSIPRDIDVLTAYCSLDNFKKHASDRLTDATLRYPIRAAWQSVVEEKRLYGIDGSDSGKDY